MNVGRVHFAIMVMICLGAGAYMSVRLFAGASDAEWIRFLPKTKPLENFLLQDQREHEFTANNLQQHWSLIYFGFSSCPDLCPMALQKMARVKRLLGDASTLQLIFISLDPERDTHSVRATYVNFFHPQLIGLSGSNQELAQVADFFGAAYSRTFKRGDDYFNVPAGFALPDNAGDDYQVNHSSRIFIVNPKAELIGSFEPPHNVEAIVSDMRLLMHQIR